MAAVDMMYAFAAGGLSFLSPCFLVIVIVAVCFVVAHELDGCDELHFAATGLSTSLVTGFSVIFVALGASMSALGQMLNTHRRDVEVFAGLVVVITGLHFVGIFGAAEALPARNGHRVGRNLFAASGAFLVGSSFALGWSPCEGPMLEGILGRAASALDAERGIIELTAYTMGLSIPFLTTVILVRVAAQRLGKLFVVRRLIQPVAGGILAVAGIFIMSGRFGDIGVALIDTLPSLGWTVL